MNNPYDRYVVKPKTSKGKVYRLADVVLTDADGNEKEYNLVDGCWAIYQDGHQTLFEFLSELKEKMIAVPDVARLYIEGRIEGWPHGPLIERLQEGLLGSYDQAQVDEYIQALRDSEEQLDEEVAKVKQLLADHEAGLITLPKPNEKAVTEAVVTAT